MRHRLPIAMLIALASAVAVPVTALAQEQELEETGNASARDARKPDDRFCIKETGSRIVATRNKSKKSDQECVNAAGRVYTREDIERTGSVDIKDALRRLDPSID